MAMIGAHGKLMVSRAELGAPVLTVATDGSAEPQAMAAELLEQGAPWWRLQMEADRCWRPHAYGEIAYTATLVARGEYAAGETYREGNIVSHNGSSYIYTNPTPSSGNAPPDAGYWDLLAASGDGLPGPPGEDGAAGLSHAAITLYRRSATTPASVTVSTTWTFATGVLSGANNGWTQTVPATNGQPLWAVQSSAISADPTDTILPDEWSAPVKVVEDGAPGAPGPAGAPVVVEIDTASYQVFAYADGSVPAGGFANAKGQLKIFEGGTDVTTSATLSAAGSGLSGTITAAGAYSVSAMPLASTSGALTMTVVYKGVTYVRVFTVSKVLTGFGIVSALPSGNLFEGRMVFLTSDEKLYRYTATGWTAAVAAVDISGTLQSAQIQSLAASKVTGQMTDAQIAAVNAAKIAGQISSAQIADGAVGAAKLSVQMGGGNLLRDGGLAVWNSGAEATHWMVYNNVNGGTPPVGQIATINRTINAYADQTFDPYQAHIKPILPGSSTSDPTDRVSTLGIRTRTDVWGTMKRGVDYIVSFDALCNTSGNFVQGFKICFADPQPDINEPILNPSPASTIFRRYAFRIRFDNNNPTPNALFISAYGSWNPPGDPTFIQFDNLQIERATTPSSFAPRPDEILPGTVGPTEIATDAVTAGKIAANAVTEGKIAANAVVADKIAAGSIVSDKLAVNAVTAGKIAADAITANTIASEAIVAGKLAANAVAANNIAANAVVAGKIAANAVTAGTIATDAVTAAKIKAGEVVAGKLAASAVVADNIAANAVTAVKISAGAVEAAKIAAGAVIADKIAADAVTANKIAANAVTATKIDANAVTADKINAGAVTAAKLASTQLDAMFATIGTLQTATTGQRFQLSDAGLRLFNSAGVEVGFFGIK